MVEGCRVVVFGDGGGCGGKMDSVGKQNSGGGPGGGIGPVVGHLEGRCIIFRTVKRRRGGETGLVEDSGKKLFSSKKIYKNIWRIV